MDCKPRVGVTLYNQSSVPVASPFGVRLTVLDAGSGARLAQADSTVGGLGAFSSTRAVFEVPVSGALLAAVDPAHVVHESNSSNNTATVDAGEMVTCPTVSVSGGRSLEGSPVRFTIRLNHGFNQPVTVGYVTEDRTARGIDFGLVAGGTIACNADYVRARGTVEFAAGSADLARVVSISTCTDSSAEGSETLALRLESLTNAQLPDTPGADIAEGRIDDAPH